MKPFDPFSRDPRITQLSPEDAAKLEGEPAPLVIKVPVVIEPEPFDKAKAIMKIFRAELYYLSNSGWRCYTGIGPEFWEQESNPGKLYTQAEAMAIQRAKDQF